MNEFGPDVHALIEALQKEVLELRGRELYMCDDGIIWHRDGDRMIPLNDEGGHVDPDAWYNRGSIEVQRMRRPDRFPTMKQLQEINSNPLKPVTELDVVRRHVGQLAARIVELDG